MKFLLLLIFAGFASAQVTQIIVPPPSAMTYALNATVRQILPLTLSAGTEITVSVDGQPFVDYTVASGKTFTGSVAFQGKEQ